MEEHVYQQIFDVEQNHWWFVGRRKIILAALKKHLKIPAKKALDIGSGTGLNSLVLRKVSHTVTGLDPAGEALRLSSLRVPEFKVVQESFPHTSITERFDLITMFDVLEHIKDDAASVKKIEDLLEPGGMALITVPAFPILWSDHDRVLQHFRRYTMKSLKVLIASQTNLKIVKINYFNTLFFPPIVLFRILRKIFHILPGRADDFMVHPFINRLFLALFRLEGKFVNSIRYPFGISIICVLRKSPQTVK